MSLYLLLILYTYMRAYDLDLLIAVDIIIIDILVETIYKTKIVLSIPNID